MHGRASWMIACAAVGLVSMLAISATEPATAADPLAVAAHIDARIQEKLELESIPVAPRSDDAEFVRRIHLDLVGCIPSAARARDFLADTNPYKRQALIEELINSPEFIKHTALVWRRWLMTEAETDATVRYTSLELEAWLRKQLAQNTPYDEMVRAIITAPLPQSTTTAYQFVSQDVQPRATPFFASNQVRPANAATAVARTFLGLRLDCAQCHDHPTGNWKQEQFWSFAAFFGELEPRQAGFFGLFKRRADGPPTLTLPNSKQKVEAAFLDGSQPEFNEPARQLLARWIVNDNNPYFAQAATNRIWSQFFGIGLSNPIDDLEQSASHPELLSDLGNAFRESGYDPRFLMRAISNSETYQRSSQATDPRQLEPHVYARFTPKKMSGYQLYESIQQAAFADTSSDVTGVDFYGNSSRDRLRQLVEAGTESAIEKPTSLLEALTLMNGEIVQAASNGENGPLIGALADMPGVSDQQRLTTLYLATLAREPSDVEMQRLLPQLSAASDAAQRQAFFSDLMWALLNSSEFALIH